MKAVEAFPLHGHHITNWRRAKFDACNQPQTNDDNHSTAKVYLPKSKPGPKPKRVQRRHKQRVEQQRVPKSLWRPF